jgi:hypothetical protein
MILHNIFCHALIKAESTPSYVAFWLQRGETLSHMPGHVCIDSALVYDDLTGDDAFAVDFANKLLTLQYFSLIAQRPNPPIETILRLL